MTVAIDATVLHQPFSGVHLSVLEEIRSLSSMVKADVYSCYDIAGIASHRTPGYTKSVPGRILWQQLMLPAILRKSGASALLSLAYTCPLRAELPVILEVHDVIALERPDLCSWKNALHMRCLLPSSINKAARILVSTSYVASRVKALFPHVSDRLEVVPLGVDYNRFASPLPLPPSLTHLAEKPYFLFVGNIEPKKSIDTLLKAFAILSERHDATLVIAGRFAWKYKRIQHMLKGWNAPGRVCLLGRVKDELLPALYQNAAAFVFPSIEEGFGLPVLEAMAAGTPVIHSDQSALMETAGNCGLYFTRENYSQLSSQMEKVLLSKSLRDELKQKGQAHAKTQAWSKWAAKVAAIVNDLTS